MSDTNTDIDNLRKACQCLYLEVHESIANDVKRKAEAVIIRLLAHEAAGAIKTTMTTLDCVAAEGCKATTQTVKP